MESAAAQSCPSKVHCCGTGLCSYPKIRHVMHPEEQELLLIEVQHTLTFLGMHTLVEISVFNFQITCRKIHSTGNGNLTYYGKMSLILQA